MYSLLQLPVSQQIMELLCYMLTRHTNTLPVRVSQCALQCVVVVFETFELQKVFGPLAALAGGGQVGDLDGGGSAADRRTSQVLRCRLVMLVQAGGAGIGLHPKGGERKERYYTKCFTVEGGRHTQKWRTNNTNAQT